jgi:hypothetical protein
MKPTCSALNCDEDLTGKKAMYCSHRCKQTVKYAIKNGRQCRYCHRPINKPVPALGGYNQYCRRTAKCRELHGS